MNNISLNDLYLSSFSIFKMESGLEKLKAIEKHLLNKYLFYKEEFEQLVSYGSTTADTKNELSTILDLTALSIMDIRDQILDFNK